MKRISFFCALLSICFLFSSCGIIVIPGKDGTSPSQTTDETKLGMPEETYTPHDYPLYVETDGEGISQEQLDTLPKMDFNGMSLFFATSDVTGDLFNDESGCYKTAVERRNQMVASAYNAKIAIVRETSAQIWIEIRTAELSGSYYADFAVLPAFEMGAYHASDLLLNLNSLPYVDFAQPYYLTSAIEQMTVGGKVYGAVGNATVSPSHYGCLYVNQTLLAKEGKTVDYAALHEGNFTWETFLQDLRTLSEDVVPFVSAYSAADTMRYTHGSIGQTFLLPDGAGSLQPNVNTVNTLSFVDTLKALAGCWEQNYTTADAERLTGFDIFKKGYSVYAFGELGHIEDLRDCGFTFEVLPLPKQSADQAYSTPVTDNAPVITALTSTSNIDVMGYILEAVNAASYGYVTKAYYDYIQRDCITGVHTLDMVDLICENPLYDFVTMFSARSSALSEGTFHALYNAVNGSREASYYLTRYESGLRRYLSSF